MGHSVVCLEAKVDAADKLPTTQKVLVDKHLLPHGRNHKVFDRLVRKHQKGVAAKIGDTQSEGEKFSFSTIRFSTVWYESTRKA